MALFLCSPAAFSAGPEGYESYDGHKDQFAITLPAGWSVYDQARALGGKPSPLGVIVFSAQPLTKEGGALADEAAVARTDTGELPSFILDRQRAAKGMSCTKFTQAMAMEVSYQLLEDPMFGAARRTLRGPPVHHDPISIGGCQGYHYRDKGKNGQWLLDVRAVSDGKVLYLFSLRNTAENFARNLETYEKAMGTVQLASGSIQQ